MKIFYSIYLYNTVNERKSNKQYYDQIHIYISRSFSCV